MALSNALGRFAAISLASASLAGAALAQNGSATVLGTADIFAAGGNSPNGGGTTPNLINLNAGTGRTLTFGAVAGDWGCASSLGFGPDGFGNCAGSSTNVSSAGSIAGIQTASRTMFL